MYFYLLAIKTLLLLVLLLLLKVTLKLFLYAFFVFSERRPTGVYGVYEALTELLSILQVFTGS